MSKLINESSEWQQLESHASAMSQTHLRDLLQDNARCDGLTAEFQGIFMDYSRENVALETMDMLEKLAKAAGVEAKRDAMASGVHINNTENRAVMHMALRAPKSSKIIVDGEDVVPGVHAVLEKINNFSDRVRNNTWVGATGKPLTTILSIGIGGSYLGPEFVYEALRTDPNASKSAAGRTLRFLANVDPVDVARALSGIDVETTLVVIVSKTFTTAETMLNARTIKHWLINGMKGVDSNEVIRKHMVAVSTAIPLAIKFGISEENIFGFWDWVGGRYSVCSAVGVLPLALYFGYSIVAQFLDGAYSMDKHFLETPIKSNLPMLLGLLGVWNASFMGYNSRAILPYAQALTRFAAHIQQVDMESNGKRVSNDGTVLPYECGEIIFGEPGTNGQHSFYQLVHQGRVIPAEFIGFCQSPNPVHLEGEVVSNHDELMSNFFAQPDALAYGKNKTELANEGVPEHLHSHKEFPGNRPSLSLLFPALTPYTCGQLLALYEHRVAVQGFIWGVNSFDQWGVELGKVLANKVRSQLSAARNTGANISGFNPSTSNMLNKYLAHGTK
jgi:glucose-6-phosphate isomerase